MTREVRRFLKILKQSRRGLERNPEREICSHSGGPESPIVQVLNQPLPRVFFRHAKTKTQRCGKSASVTWMERPGLAEILQHFEVQYHFMWINSLACRCKPWNNSAKCKLLNSNRLWSGFRRENFAWFCMLELPLADLAQDGQGVEMEELQLAHAAELQRLQTQHQVATVYWNETGLWSGSKQLFPRKWCNNVQHMLFFLFDIFNYQVSSFCCLFQKSLGWRLSWTGWMKIIKQPRQQGSEMARVEDWPCCYS